MLAVRSKFIIIKKETMNYLLNNNIFCTFFFNFHTFYIQYLQIKTEYINYRQNKELKSINIDLKNKK